MGKKNSTTKRSRWLYFLQLIYPLHYLECKRVYRRKLTHVGYVGIENAWFDVFLFGHIETGRITVCNSFSYLLWVMCRTKNLLAFFFIMSKIILSKFKSMDIKKICTHSLIFVNAQKMKMNCETVSLPNTSLWMCLQTETH